MPSTRASNFKGGGGILRRKDGTILDILFTTENPLFKDEPKAAPANSKNPDFKWLYGILFIQEDGREDVTKQPLKVGDVKDFTPVLDGRGVSGTVAFGKNSQFGVFMASLATPKDGGDGQPEDTYPEDPAGLVADYTNIKGSRVMFDWVKDESDWAKKNPRVVKKQGQPDKKYDRENLVVAQYYGQVPNTPAVNRAAGTSAAKPATKTTTGGRPAVKPAAAPAAPAAPAASTEDIAAAATNEVIKALVAKKGKFVGPTKLSVALMTQMGDGDQNLSNAVRLWASKVENLKTIDGVVFNEKGELSIPVED